MAQIQVTDLTFAYDGSADDIFENATFNMDTDWKLGLIGRNGKYHHEDQRKDLQDQSQGEVK